MRTLFSSILFAFILSFGFYTPASAAGWSDFPSCLNPQGTVKVSYSEGTHGIPGDRSTYTGSDVVYQLDGNTKLLQCFCADNGDGIQTLWYKTSSLTDQEKDSLIRDGWISVPNGTVWGLDNVEYLAKNYPYACGPRAIGGGELVDMAGTGNSAALFGFFSSGMALLLAGALRIRRGVK